MDNALAANCGSMPADTDSDEFSAPIENLSRALGGDAHMGKRVDPAVHCGNSIRLSLVTVFPVTVQSVPARSTVAGARIWYRWPRT